MLIEILAIFLIINISSFNSNKIGTIRIGLGFPKSVPI